MDPVNILDTLNELDIKIKTIHEASTSFILRSNSLSIRKTDECNEFIEEAVKLIAEVGVSIVDLRALSWQVYLNLRAVGQNVSFRRTFENLRQEIRDSIYSLAQLNSSLSEILRSVRSFKMY